MSERDALIYLMQELMLHLRQAGRLELHWMPLPGPLNENRGMFIANTIVKDKKLTTSAFVEHPPLMARFLFDHMQDVRKEMK